MRPVLALLPALALLAPLPASAQESPGVCPNVAYAVSREQLAGPAGVPVTLRFGSDVGPGRTPDGWTLTRVRPEPAVLLETLPAAPSATFTVTAQETSTYRVTSLGPGDCEDASAEFTRTVTAPAPTPTALDVPCPVFSLTTTTAVSGATRTVTATPRQALDGRTYRLRLSRTTPAPEAVVRDVAATGTTATSFTVRLGETHRLVLEAFTTDAFCLPASSTSVTAPVEAVVTLAARRSSPRAYTFTGRVQPAAGTVSLFRVEAGRGRVLTARTDVRRDGTYRVDRRFTGSGRFGFVVVADAGTGGRHVGGSSAVRPTVVH